MRNALLLALLPLALAGCGRSDDSGADADMDRRLNEAAASIDINATANLTEPQP